MQAILSQALAFLRILAAQTETKLDDLLVDLLQAIVDSPALLSWFSGLLSAAPSEPDGVLKLTAADVPYPVLEEISARKINLADLLSKLPALIKLVRTLTGK